MYLISNGVSEAGQTFEQYIAYILHKFDLEKIKQNNGKQCIKENPLLAKPIHSFRFA